MISEYVLKCGPIHRGVKILFYASFSFSLHSSSYTLSSLSFHFFPFSLPFHLFSIIFLSLSFLSWYLPHLTLSVWISPGQYIIIVLKYYYFSIFIRVSLSFSLHRSFSLSPYFISPLSLSVSLSLYLSLSFSSLENKCILLPPFFFKHIYYIFPREFM